MGFLISFFLWCCSGVHLFVTQVCAVCPERCDCYYTQHILCANRGLREVPYAPRAEDARVLALAGNFIHNLSAIDFISYGNLVRLNLQFNQITNVHTEAFERLPKLRELYLGYNSISAIQPGTLQSLRTLTTLYLNNNEMMDCIPESFRHLSSLVKLRLDGNSIQVLKESIFKDLTNLIFLHLESNQLRHIDPNAFSQLRKLQFLNISDNKQTELGDILTFSHLKSLTTLLITDNHVWNIGKHVFQSLKNLSKLSLSRNKISQLHVEALKGLSSLNELMIDRNELTEVPSGLLDPLEAIEHLDLSENHISHIDPSAFGHLLHLKILKLNNNRLKVLSERVLSVNRALLQVDLNGNNWTCDCRMEKLKNWLTQAHSQGNLLNMFVHCLHPKVLAGKNLDYVSSKQLGNLSSCDSKPIVSDGSVAGLKEEREKREGGKHVEIRVQADEMEQGPLTILQSKKKRKPFRSRKAGNGSYSDSTVAPFLEGQSISASQEPLKDQANNHVSRVLEMITDACQFNQHSILNVCVKDVTSSSATVHWSTTPDDELLQGKELNFRILFDRFGHAFRFPRYVYTLGSEQAVTLQELHPDSTYVTCVESVVDGTVCQVAPRDHCVGFVTLLPSFTSEVNLKVVTAAALVGNALLLLLIGGFWLGRALKRKIKNRKLSTHRHVHHMYSTRLPFRSAVAKTCVSSEFSGYQSGRPLSEERDLIQFPNDRFFHNSPTQRNEDAVMFRCSN